MGSFVVQLTPAEAKKLGVKPTKVKLDKASWPDKVPVLKAKDICKGAYDKGAKRDIVGWRNEVFLGSLDKVSNNKDKILLKITTEIRKAITEACEQLDGRLFDESMQISEFNDADDITPAQVAEVWNKAMTALGYDAEGNRIKKTKEKKTK